MVEDFLPAVDTCLPAIEHKDSSATILSQFHIRVVNIFSAYFRKICFKIILQHTPCSPLSNFFPQDFTVRMLHACMFLP
jgi:hypothetical protein